jgi:DNA-binding MarR family transcriptional regulator
MRITRLPAGMIAQCNNTGARRLVKMVANCYQFQMMHPPTKRAETLAALLAHIGRAGDRAALMDGLTAAQWNALRYFAEANAISRTVSALARFCATTRGPASKTVKALIDSGHLARRRSPDDGRSSRIDLTGKGRDVIARDPFNGLIAAIGRLPADERRALDSATDRLLAAMPRGDGTCFGTCPTCDHFNQPAPDRYACAWRGIALDPTETDQICAAYTPAASPNA